MLVVAKGYRELLEKSQTVVTPDSDPEKPTVGEFIPILAVKCTGV